MGRLDWNGVGWNGMKWNGMGAIRLVRTGAGVCLEAVEAVVAGIVALGLAGGKRR